MGAVETVNFERFTVMKLQLFCRALKAGIIDVRKSPSEGRRELSDISRSSAGGYKRGGGLYILILPLLFFMSPAVLAVSTCFDLELRLAFSFALLYHNHCNLSNSLYSKSLYNVLFCFSTSHSSFPYVSQLSPPSLLHVLSAFTPPCSLRLLSSMFSPPSLLHVSPF